MKCSTLWLLVALGLLVTLGLIPCRVQATQPNVIIILSDDAGYADFGITGSTLVPTPNIDRLARDGIFCSQGYVTGSTCTPSRMGLMSGRYQQRFGAECNVPTIPTPGFSKTDLGLDTRERTLGNVMKSIGYRTIAIGKWHLGELPKYHPNERGFDDFYGFLGGSRSYWPLEKARRGTAMRRDRKPVDEQSEITYLTDNLTDAAIDFVKQNRDHPFFIYLSYNAVHSPFQAKDEDLEQCPKIAPKNRWMVSAMTKSMDDNVGRLLAQLDQLRLTENTLIVFLNDNGGTQGTAHSNGALRGFKGTYWEGGIRVPFIASWPAKLPKSKRFNHPVSSLDLLPTCLAAGGGQVDPSWQMDGVNLLPYFTGDRDGAPHDLLFWRFWRVTVVRDGSWKLLRVAEDPLQEERTLLAPLMLINLDEDPRETTNLAVKYPDKTNTLLEKMESWEQTLAQPRWYDGSKWKHWQEEQLKNHRMVPQEGTNTEDKSVADANANRCLVGVYYFAGWWEELPNKYTPRGTDWRNTFPDRIPLLGLYNDQPTMDKEIVAASEHGVDFFQILWYPVADAKLRMDAEGRKMAPHTEKVNEGLRLFLNSSVNDKLQFTIEYVNHAPFGITDDAAWEKACRTWGHAMQHPSYLRVGGRPVFKIHGLTAFRRQTNGDPDLVARRVATIRRITREMGLPNPLIGVGASPLGIPLPDALAPFDFVTTYMEIPRLEKRASLYPYEQLLKLAEKGWQDYATKCDKPYIPYLPAGWDPRPWQDPRPSFELPTQQQWRSALESVSNHLNQHDNLGLKTHVGRQKLFLIYAWNEFGEGGIVAPTQGDGYMKLETIKEIFGTPSDN